MFIGDIIEYEKRSIERNHKNYQRKKNTTWVTKAAAAARPIPEVRNPTVAESNP